MALERSPNNYMNKDNLKDNKYKHTNTTNLHDSAIAYIYGQQIMNSL